MNGNAFITKITNAIVVPLVEVVALAAFVVFIWGVVEFIRGASEPEARNKGTQHMVWGLVGLAIIFGAGAIVTLLKTLLTNTLAG